MMTTIRCSETTIILAEIESIDMRPWMTFYGSVKGFNADHALYSNKEIWISMPQLHSVMYITWFG
jgi:hypothetical protein